MKYNGLRQIRDTKLPIRTAQALAKFGQKIGSACDYTEDGGNCSRTSFIISYLHKTLTERPNQQSGTRRSCCAHGKTRNSFTISFENPEERYQDSTRIQTHDIRRSVH